MKLASYEIPSSTPKMVSLMVLDVKVFNVQLHITGTEYLCLDTNILLKNSFLI